MSSSAGAGSVVPEFLARHRREQERTRVQRQPSPGSRPDEWPSGEGRRALRARLLRSQFCWIWTGKTVTNSERLGVQG